VSSVNWDSVLDAAAGKPIWDGWVMMPVGELKSNGGLRWYTTLWWQVWDSARMDIGFTSSAASTDDVDDDAASEQHKLVRELTSGLVSEMIVPLYAVSEHDWKLERTAGIAELAASRSTGRPRMKVASKVVVRVPEGRELEPLMNAVLDFGKGYGQVKRFSNWR